MNMMVMSKLTFLVFMAFSSMEVKILWARALNFFLATADVSRLISSARVVSLNVMAFVASFRLRICFVS